MQVTISRVQNPHTNQSQIRENISQIFEKKNPSPPSQNKHDVWKKST